MVVNVPRIVDSVANDPREMVRVRFSERDTRSYTRLEAEKLLAGGGYPDAFIVGDQDVRDAAAQDGGRLAGRGATFEEAAEDLKGKAGAKSQKAAPNKGRQAAPSKSAGAPASDPPAPPSDPPATEPADGAKGA